MNCGLTCCANGEKIAILSNKGQTNYLSTDFWAISERMMIKAGPKEYKFYDGIGLDYTLRVGSESRLFS